MTYHFSVIIRLISFCFVFTSTTLFAQVFVPQNGTNQINCGLNTTLCDHGGCSTDYGANADGYTIIQTIGTASVSFTGNYTLGVGEQIIIYNGAGTGGAILNTLTGSGTYTFGGTPGQQVTVRFISDGSNQAAGFSFTVTYTGACTFPGTNFGTSGTQVFPCATNRIFYDNGGAGGNYTNNVNSTVTLNNTGSGIYTVSGTYTLAVSDFVRIYRGVGTGGILLGTYTNATGTIIYTSQPGEALTIEFVSNSSTVAAGFAINVSHYGGCSCPSTIMTATATPASICAGQNSQLSANGLVNLANYSLSYPPYVPLACSGAPNGVGPIGDDVSSAPVTLPFPFTFFGTTYTQFGVSSNANIQFGPGPYSNTYTPTGSGIPTTSIDNLVALNFGDWISDAGDITWHVQGTAPNQVMVICFNTLHPYPYGTAGNLTGQIVLYEGSNIIDLVLTDSWMDPAASTYGIQTQGIQDAQGVGVPVPGHNATSWTATNNTVRFTPTLNYTYSWSPPTFLNSTTIPNPLATAVTATTNYTVTASLGTAGACTQTANATVTVQPTPIASITGTNSICSGQSTTLTATGGGTYLWSTGATTPSISVSPMTTTVYTVTVSNGSCSVTAPYTVNVTTTPVPNPTASPSSICLTQSSTITASGGGTYLWNTGATTSSITVSPAVTTTYSVTVDNGGCIASGSTTLTVSPTGSPIITCPADVNLSACNPVATFATPTATDPCAAVVCASAPLATVLSNFNANGAAITGAIPNPYNFTLDGGVTGTSISDGGNDMYDGGNSLNTNLGTAIPYTNGTITSNAFFGAGGQYFTTNVNNMFVMAANMANVSTFSITGNNGADGSGTANGFNYTVAVGCITYDVFVKRVNGAGDPSINQIVIVPTGSGASQTFDVNTDNSLQTVSGLNSATRLYYLLVGGAGGYAYTNAEIQALVVNFLTQTGASGSAAPPVVVTQTSGLPSGSSFPIGTTTVTFQATGGSGLISTCSFDVNVAPTSGPNMTCPTDINLGACNPVATFSAPTAVDPCAPLCATSSLGTILTNFNTNGAAITSAIPNPYNFTLDNGPTATSISDGGNDMYDGGNFINTNLTSGIAYTNGVVTANAAFGAGGQYFTQKVNNMFVMAADLNGITSFSISGNNGADGSGVVNGFTYAVTIGCQAYDVFVKRVNSATDPSINQIFIVPSGSAAAHSFAASTDNTQHDLTGIAAATRLYYLLVAGNSGYAYTNAEIQTIVQNFLTQTNATVASPVVVTQIAGLPSGSSFPVGTNVVTYQATGSSGTSTCSFNVIVHPMTTAITASTTDVCPSINSTLTATGGTTYSWNTGATSDVIVVAPVTTTNYTVTATDAYGCTGTASQSITANTASTTPTIAPIGGSYCPNVDVVLTAAGGTAGTGSVMNWYTGPNGTGTLLGTGSSIIVTTTTTMTIYARREGICNTTGDASMLINVKNFVYAPTGASTSSYCTDNTGWHHFYTGNDIIFSVSGDLSGVPTATASIIDNGSFYQQTQGPGSALTCGSNISPGEERFEMERSWNLNIGAGTLSGLYDVRFYYQPAERTAIETAAINWMATYPACGYSYKYATPNGFYWFKNLGSDYTAPDYDGTHYPATVGATPNSINYAEWSGIPSFSGGSGAVILLPVTGLPVTMSSFTAVCNENNSATIQWTTASENNSSHFVLERSNDGSNWGVVGQMESAGNSTSSITYEMIDQNVRGYDIVYYRLKQYDTDGNNETFGPVTVSCEMKEIGFLAHPNPTSAEITVTMFGELDESSTVISFFDVQGKEVKKIQYTKETGRIITVDLEGLATGCYIIQMRSGDEIMQPIRIIKQ
jgi:hypothetical protein